MVIFHCYVSSPEGRFNFPVNLQVPRFATSPSPPTRPRRARIRRPDKWRATSSARRACGACTAAWLTGNPWGPHGDPQFIASLANFNGKMTIELMEFGWIWIRVKMTNSSEVDGFIKTWNILWVHWHHCLTDTHICGQGERWKPSRARKNARRNWIKLAS